MQLLLCCSVEYTSIDNDNNNNKGNNNSNNNNKNKNNNGNNSKKKPIQLPLTHVPSPFDGISVVSNENPG